MDHSFDEIEKNQQNQINPTRVSIMTRPNTLIQVGDRYIYLFFVLFCFVFN